MNPRVVHTFLALQAFVVAFILLHDWLPLGRLNNLAGIRAVDPPATRNRVTLLSALPFGLCLWFSSEYAHAPRFPMWVQTWLWVTYGIGALGAIRA
jgi:hypothetical protein